MWLQTYLLHMAMRLLTVPSQCSSNNVRACKLWRPYSNNINIKAFQQQGTSSISKEKGINLRKKSWGLAWPKLLTAARLCNVSKVHLDFRHEQIIFLFFLDPDIIFGFQICTLLSLWSTFTVACRCSCIRIWYKDK